MSNNIKSSLIVIKKISIEDVIESLIKHKNDTDWSIKTSNFAIDYIKRNKKNYSKCCIKGFLPESFFGDILLPEHGHLEDCVTGILLFPNNISVNDSLEYYNNPNPNFTKECSMLVTFLKEQIRENGFNNEIILELVDNKLIHIDGLHRMIALKLLLEEGYEYKPIPVYILIR